MSSQACVTEHLVAEVKSADKAASGKAMTALLSHVYPRLLGYSERLTGGTSLAEDVAQETMVRVITGIGRFRAVPGRPGAFQAWVFTIATNVYRDYIAKSSRTALVPDLRPLERANPGSPTEDEVVERLEMEAVGESLLTLSLEQRTVFVLKTYYGYSYKEIAEISGCPEGTAKSRLHHAVLALKADLERRGML